MSNANNQINHINHINGKNIYNTNNNNKNNIPNNTTQLSPIHSETDLDTEKNKSHKKPTKQNKRNGSYDESETKISDREDNKLKQTLPNTDLLPIQSGIAVNDDLSELPKTAQQTDPKLMHKVNSVSNLTASPSITVRSDGGYLITQLTNPSMHSISVDSSSVIKPSEVKKRSIRSDKVTSNILDAPTATATATTTSPKSDFVRDMVNAVDDALLFGKDQDDLKHSNSMKTQRLKQIAIPVLKEESVHDHDHMHIPLDNMEQNKIINREHKQNDNENDNENDNDNENKKKPHNKCFKCFQCYRNCVARYAECAQRSICCKKFKRLQYYGRKYITTTSLFKYVILLCILGNCVFIALEDPTGDPNSGINQLVKKAENIFAAIFTVEMVIKMLCNGLFGEHMTDNNDDDIEKERNHNKQNEENNHNNDNEPSISKNRINPSNYSFDNDEKAVTTVAIDRKQELEMADLGLNVNVPTIPIKSNVGKLKRSKTPSVSSGDKATATATASTISWETTVKSSTVDTEKQQNDILPSKYVGYFRDNWNILDFIIVVTSWIEWLPIEAGSNFTAIRVLRVLRPLRTFTKIKSLKVLIATIIKSLRGLSDVMVLLLFLFIVFAIIGIQMFNGALHQQCFSEDFRDRPRNEWCCDDPTKWVEDEFFCKLNLKKDPQETGNNDISYNGCPIELPWCLNIAPNPNGGVTNFDNIGYGILNVFVSISLEGWAAIQYKLEDTGKDLAWMYFIPLTFIVGFFAANLCLAVIESVYGEEMEKKHKKEKRDGDDPIEKRAIYDTEVAWRASKKAKMVIMQSPTNKTATAKDMHMMNYGNCNYNYSHNVDNSQDIIPPPLIAHLNINDATTNETPVTMTAADRDNDLDIYDASFIKSETFRLPYNLNGEESTFRTRIVMELPKNEVDNIANINSKGAGGYHGHYRSKSLATTPNNRLDVGGIMSTHQAGLIQTSQEWHDLQIHNMNKENMKKKKLNHHKQTSSFKLPSKKDKKVQFQHASGLGTKSYMHRYRTGDVPRNDTVSPAEVRDSISAKNKKDSISVFALKHSASHAQLQEQSIKQSKKLKLSDTKHKYKHKKKLSNKITIDTIDRGFMSENDIVDEFDGTDLDIDTDNEIENENVNVTATAPPPIKNNNNHHNHNNLAVEEARKKFRSSQTASPNRSMQSVTMTRSIQQNTARRDVLLKKVDYKSTTQDTFIHALERVQTFVNVEADKQAYHTAHTSGSLEWDNMGMDSRGRVDDLTFGDMPIHASVHTRHTHHKGNIKDLQKEKEKSRMSDELRRRAHRAKQKRKSNEILARKAILIANMRPSYMEWVEARDAIWITKINAFVVSPIFQTFIMMIIIANTIVLALTWPQQNQELKNILETVNTVFTFIFILEAVLKLIGLGLRSYFEDNWNKFDFIIVMVSIIEMVIALASPNGSMNSGGSAISALRSMRLLRAFRLLGKFDSLKQLFMLVVASMHEVSILTMVLGIFIFMFAALAMSLFGGKLIELGDRRTGRWRYDNFYWSWVNVFMVISGDSWNEVMYDTVKATDNQITVIYYVIVVCFGTFVILNLFVAILLSKMGSEESDEDFMLDGLEKYSRTMFVHDVDEADQVDRLVMSIERKKYIAQFKDKRSKWKHHRDKKKIEGKSLGIFEPRNTFRVVCHKIVHWRWFEISIDTLILINCIFLALESKREREKNGKMFFVADMLFTVIFVLEFIIKVIALGAFQQPFRKRRTWTKIKDDNKLIEWTDRSYQAVFFMHKLNPIGILDLPGLAIECIRSNDGYCIVHVWGQQVLRIVFYNGSWLTGYKLIDQNEGTWEIFHENLEKDIDNLLDKELQKVLTSFDLTDHYHNAYFASNWNRLDAFVVLVAVMGVGFENVSFLRALRAFRPFRIMVRFKKIKVVLGALLRAIPGLFNTFLFCILFWFVLSILGVNWYNGLYRHCRIDDEDIYCADENNICDENYVMYNFNKQQCDGTDGLLWFISVFNFDNVFQALHAMFCVATLSGWNFVMYEAIDSTKFNQALIEDNKPEAAVYFMVTVVLCSFFSLNLIVSVVVDNFNTIKAEKDGSAFQTEEQALWVNNQRLLERISLNPTFSIPKNWFRAFSFKIVEHDLFDPFIMACIILNAVSMGAEVYNQPHKWTVALRIADVVFVVIFCMEAILKISAHGFRLYILSNWNKFDFIISIIGVVGLLTDSGLGLNVLRLFRVGRLLRLLHQAKTLKMLFWTLVYSIPSLWNIGLLLFVIFFIYAVVGMHVLTSYVTAVDSEVNANNFWNAIRLLYRVGTEDGWTDIYQSYLEAWPVNERYKIYIYFISFFVLGTLVLINLFIAVVLDSFEENHQSFSREDKFITIQIWRDIWSYFDPNAKRELPVRDFIDILKLTPMSEAFEKKNKIKGPGFHPESPFKTLSDKLRNEYELKNNTPSRSKSQKLMKSLSMLSGDKNNEANMSNSQLTKKLTTIYDVDERCEQLKSVITKVDHADMIKLLMRLRLRVELRLTNTDQLTCVGKLAKLIYDICNSMGIGNRSQSDEIIRQHTLKESKQSLKELRKDILSDLNDEKEKEKEKKNSFDDFDVGDNTWYVSYDDALLAICSEVIGPRLPDGFPMFQIAAPSDEYDDVYNEPAKPTQLRIADWYMIKYDCYDTWKAVNLENEQNKQYAEIVPSQHVSDERQLQLKNQTQSAKFRKEFKRLTQQINENIISKITNEIKEEENENDINNEGNNNTKEATNTNEFVDILIDEYNDMDMDDEDDDDIAMDLQNPNRSTNLNVDNVSHEITADSTQL